MNTIVNKLSLAGDTLMPKIHLRQPGIMYSACGPFTKNKERIKKFLRNMRFQINLSKSTR